MINPQIKSNNYNKLNSKDKRLRITNCHCHDGDELKIPELISIPIIMKSDVYPQISR